MADNTDTWTLSLKDMMTAPAATMTAGLRALNTAQTMAAASGNALAKIPAPRGADGRYLKKGSEEWKAAMEAAKSGATAVNAAGEAVSGGGQRAAKGMSAFTNASRSLGRALMISGGAMGKLVGFLSQLGPYGQAAAVAISVVSAVVEKTVGTLAALGAKAIEVTQHLGIMTARFAAFGGSAAAGKAATEMVQRLSAELPIATGQIEEWAASLQRAGVSGKELESATRAIAAASALNPAGGAQAAQELFQKLATAGKESKKLITDIAEQTRKGMGPLREMGVSLEDLGGEAKVAKMSAGELSAALQNVLQAKGGNVLAKMWGDPAIIFAKVKEGLASVFEGLGPAVEPFTSALRSIGSEFMRGGVAANLLRAVVVPVFTKLFEWGTKALTAIHKGFLLVMIAGLTTYIAMRPLLAFLADFIGSANMLRGVAIVFGLMALPWVILAAAVLTVVTLFGVVVGAIVAVAAALVYVVGAIAGFVASIGSAFADAYSAATGAGGSIVDGLVAGVVAGAGAFMDAISGLASKGLAAFKGVFGIASPSKVMLEHGDQNIAGALATGVDRGADKVDASMGRLGGGAKPGAKGGDRDGGGRTYIVNFNGPVGDKVDRAMIREVIEMTVLEWEREAATS